MFVVVLLCTVVVLIFKNQIRVSFNVKCQEIITAYKNTCAADNPMVAKCYDTSQNFNVRNLEIG